MPEELAPLPPTLHVAALLRHITRGLEGTTPPPYALTATPDTLVLLEGQRAAATTGVSAPDDATDLRTLLVDKAREILDEAQDLVVSSLSSAWPQPAAHPAAAWDGDRIVLGFYPAGDLALEPVLALPPYAPPTGPPRVAG